jgi:hypothetical protein
MIVVGGLTAVNLLAPHLLDDMRTRTAVTILVEIGSHIFLENKPHCRNLASICGCQFCGSSQFG